MESKSIFIEGKTVLTQLIDAINMLTLDEYTQKIELMSNSTIGEHTRHIIELFQQLQSGYESGNINYDARKREIRIQTDVDYAVESIATIISHLELPNKKIGLSSVYNNNEEIIESNYYRELMYNIEHCIHHQAIIKIGLLSLDSFHINDNFGVAKSTIIYREQCAQ